MVKDLDRGNPQSGTESTQKVRKLSRLSLTGFILSLLTLGIGVLLRLPVKLPKVLDNVLTAGVLIGFVATLVFSIAGMISSKNGKRRGWQFGLAGIIILVLGQVFMVLSFILFFIFGHNSRITSTTTEPTETTFNPQSTVITGTPKIFGHEITLPCTIGELKAMGFDVDYDVAGGGVQMWPADGREHYMRGPHFECKLDRDSYDDSKNLASDDSIVVAIEFQEYNKVEFDFHNISFKTTEDVILSSFGVPAFEEDNELDGHKSFYKGDNGLMYRFSYSYSNCRTYNSESDKDRSIWIIMFGTEEYMKTKGIYY
ncbi:MAG: YrzE family protein [Saccharofermentans sp.]|nr:YrzE family protein [Saccharofermentans sp.]